MEWSEHAFNHLETLTRNIEDPRDRVYVLYPIGEIIFLVIAANLCGIESWRGIELFGERRLSWLRKYLPFRDGVPSRFTIARIFSIIRPAYFEALIGEVGNIVKEKNRENSDSISNIIAIDGKTLCSASKIKQSPLHLLNAISTEDGIVLSQVKCFDKSNEINAIPYILETLQLTGATVTMDAIACQKSIVKKIRKLGGDFVIPVKENQPALFRAVSTYFEYTGLTPENSQYFYETVEKSRGRVEKRSYQIAYRPQEPIFKLWTGVHSIAMAISEVFRNGVPTSEVRYFISSLEPNPGKIARAIRSHWSVENRLHWVLDVVFNEDRDIKRKNHAPRNYAAIRKIAINLIRGYLGRTTGVKEARMLAALDPEQMEKILNHTFS